MLTSHAPYNPIIVYANNTELPPGRTFGDWTVPSRMLLWCHGGDGEIEVNGITYPINDQRFYFLPWNHNVTYYPGTAARLSLAGVHLIPDLPIGEPVDFAVPHLPEERFGKDTSRRDARITGLEGLILGMWQDHASLSLLAEYIVHWYRNGVPTEEAARWLARQLIMELQQIPTKPIDDSMQLPERLQRILGFVWNHLHLPIRAEDLANAGECNASTVQRLFQQHFADTPTRYIQKRRIEKATHLLADTLFPVAEIGQLVGIKDPFYFSKLFHRFHGITATQFRRHSTSPARGDETSRA